MRRALTGLAVTALALPMLSACIIVADGDSSSTQITYTRSDTSIPNLRAFNSDGSTITASLVTSCASASDFETTVRSSNKSDRTLTVRQKSASNCNGTARNLQLSWSYQELNLQAGQTVRVTNPVVL